MKYDFTMIDLEMQKDLDMWIRMWTKYEMYNLQENLVQYRIYWENSILKQQKLMIQNTLKQEEKH